jgi:hypothetical protein
MNRCTDPAYHHMLHAWELGMLSKDDRQGFEMHLLQCDACASEADQFFKASRLLRNDPDFRPSEDELPMDRLSGDSKPGTFRRDVTRVLLAVAAVLILAVPVYLWMGSPSQESAPVQQLKLVPIRGGGENAVRREVGGTVEIRFYVEGASAALPCRVKVSTQHGLSVYTNNKFSDFSSSGTGVFVLRVDDLETGQYTLTVSPAGDSLNILQTYNFRVQ